VARCQPNRLTARSALWPYITLTNAKHGRGRLQSPSTSPSALPWRGTAPLAIDLAHQGNLSVGRGFDLNKVRLTRMADNQRSRRHPPRVMGSVIHHYLGVAEATAMRKGVVESSTTSTATFDF